MESSNQCSFQETIKGSTCTCTGGLGAETLQIWRYVYNAYIAESDLQRKIIYWQKGNKRNGPTERFNSHVQTRVAELHVCQIHAIAFKAARWVTQTQAVKGAAMSSA